MDFWSPKIIQKHKKREKFSRLRREFSWSPPLTKIVPTPLVKTLSNSTYAELESNLKSAYGTKKSVIGACVNFMSRKQKSGESIEVYSKSLNQLASMCDYGSCCETQY